MGEEAFKRLSTNLNGFKVRCTLKDMLQSQAKDFVTIKREIEKCKLKDALNVAQKKRCVNAVLSKNHLKVLQKETFQAGISSVVLGKMYNALYGFLTDLKEHPV